MKEKKSLCVGKRLSVLSSTSVCSEEDSGRVQKNFLQVRLRYITCRELTITTEVPERKYKFSQACQRFR